MSEAPCVHLQLKHTTIFNRICNQDIESSHSKGIVLTQRWRHYRDFIHVDRQYRPVEGLTKRSLILLFYNKQYIDGRVEVTITVVEAATVHNFTTYQVNVWH